jgi:hypothetical protein
MKLDDVITSKYLKQSDFPKPALVTVADCERANVAQKDETPEYKLVIELREYDKKFVCNTTNAKRLFRWLGNDTDEWIGKKFVLFNDEDVEFGGKITGGLRVREYIAKGATVPQKPVRESENPAPVDEDESLPF